MDKTETIYGNLPVDLGPHHMESKEMMFWMYCPVKLPGETFPTLPPNLRQYHQLLVTVMHDPINQWRDSYVYLTAKTLWVTPDNPGNRPGWHSDGFLTDDLNYIWSDRAPTVFFYDTDQHAFTADHSVSLVEMEELCKRDEFDHVTYPDMRLLRLDETVLHRSPVNFEPGMRTFVKISVSRHRYALEGNSINHDLPWDAEYKPRLPERNCPIGNPDNELAKLQKLLKSRHPGDSGRPFDGFLT